MREIKFRAWDINNKKMFRVDRIDYRDDNFGIREVRRATEYPINVADKMYYDLLEIELMQFTGLTDVNDREIYEGDIITSEDNFNKGKLVYRYGCFQIKYGREKYKLLINTAYPKVIGNIYQHKHLLKENE